jgi:hypothetical protein
MSRPLVSIDAADFASALELVAKALERIKAGDEEKLDHEIAPLLQMAWYFRQCAGET